MTRVLPAHWRASTLEVVCSSLTDGDHLAPPKAERGVPFITISAMNDGNVSLQKATRFVPRSYYEGLSDDRRPRSGDILLSVTGSLGIAAPVITDEPFVFQRHIAILRPNRQAVDGRFLLYFLRSTETRDGLAQGSTGTAQMTIALGTLRRFPIQLPPLPEQRRIVARIEALFARTRRARTDLERIAPLSRRYIEATTDRAFLADEDAGWTTSTAGQLCDIKSGLTLGKRYASETELVERPYLRVANVQRGHLRLDKIKTVRLAAAEAARLVLRDGDVLMNEGGDRDKLGRGWVWEGQIPNCVHQNHVFRLRLRSNMVTPRFLSRYANQAGARYFLDEGKQTTNLASISMSKVAALPVPVPPKGVAARIDGLLDATEASARILQAEATRALALLDRLEQSILARAFRGDLAAHEQSEDNGSPSPDVLGTSLLTAEARGNRVPAPA